MIALLPLILQAASPAPAPATVATRTVTAVGETEAVASARDAADDLAIWRDARRPARSLIVATDKQRGLNVYDLTGRQRFTIAAGRLNNVDLAEIRIGGRRRIVVVASDRTDRADSHLALFDLDPVSAVLTPLALVRVGVGEAYGLCLYHPRGQALQAFLVNKDGLISQVALDFMGAVPRGRVVRTLRLATQSEGCVTDPRTGSLFVGEEDVGVWRFDADAHAPTAGRLIAPVDGVRLVADVEGLAIARTGARGGWLIVSSQGDSAYAAYRLSDFGFAGRFRIAAGRFGATSDTDGIEISTASFGRGLEGGIMVAQDGDNAPHAQNFKIVRWRDVARTLRLR